MCQSRSTSVLYIHAGSHCASSYHGTASQTEQHTATPITHKLHVCKFAYLLTFICGKLLESILVVSWSLTQVHRETEI